MEPGESLSDNSPAAPTSSSAWAGCWLIAVGTTSAPASASASAPAPETAAGTFFARTSLINGQGASLPLLAAERLGGSIRAFLGGHGHEGEAARPAAHFIHHEINLGDRAVLGEKILKIIFGGIIREIAHIQFSVHDDFFA
jgi:hypothetical protein